MRKMYVWLGAREKVLPSACIYEPALGLYTEITNKNELVIDSSLQIIYRQKKSIVPFGLLEK